ncbi:energy-coupling factor ABC transporter substrate-binding protein [Metabacillus litoralis]|uniref:energy-coupling factor ABC transporter substrate-binding protein n=1 Tax=Metabacillus litoralis TaxID=152268 RepID=UPI001CFED2DB|nr:energy-coupling factor ABC transporter substrate-binding protein [Metabacillus litoralis]
MKNFILFLFVIILATFPFFIQRDTDFGGADGQAEEAITELAPSYEPWFKPFWSPPGGETESLLFSLQAAVGAIIIGYVIGFGRARRKYSAKQ